MGGQNTFTGETLVAAKGSREEALRTVCAVLNRFPERGDYFPLLQALFAEGRKQLHHGDKPSPEWAVARREWLERCRTWMEEQGYTPYSTQIPASMQRAYVKATGDVFVPPAGTEA